jgi:hypothetical protein
VIERPTLRNEAMSVSVEPPEHYSGTWITYL